MTTEKIKNPPGSDHEDLIEIGRQELRAAPGGITKVLLVDDEDQFRSSLAKRLASRGYEVLEAADGEQALLAVRHDKPQVVILDQKMPKMEGLEALEAIKELDSEVQVIMLTGHATMEAARVTGKQEALSLHAETRGPGGFDREDQPRAGRIPLCPAKNGIPAHRGKRLQELVLRT